MSYEIYKSINQLGDGTFMVMCASSNDYPKYFHSYHMTWFKDNWPTATPDEQRALWELYSIGSGERFYPANWKKNKKLADKFMTENGYDWWTHTNDPALWLKYAQEFIKYKKAKAKTIKKKFVVSMLFCGSRNYVVKKSTRRVWPIFDKAKAKVFTAESITDVENMFTGYASYKPIVEEI